MTRGAIHAGTDGPKFVFGKKNLDYREPVPTFNTQDLYGAQTGVIDDFAATWGEDTKYGDYGTLTEEQEAARQKQVAGGFAEYIKENDMTLDDYFDLDDEEQDDMQADYINFTPDLVADDYTRLGEELSLYEFSRVEK